MYKVPLGNDQIGDASTFVAFACANMIVESDGVRFPDTVLIENVIEKGETKTKNKKVLKLTRQSDVDITVATNGDTFVRVTGVQQVHRLQNRPQRAAATPTDPHPDSINSPGDSPVDPLVYSCVDFPVDSPADPPADSSAVPPACPPVDTSDGPPIDPHADPPRYAVEYTKIEVDMNVLNYNAAKVGESFDGNVLEAFSSRKAPNQ